MFSIYIFTGNLFSTWKDYFFLGSYTSKHLTSVNAFIQTIYDFMTRHTNSVSNFILFFTTLTLFTYGLIKSFQKKTNLAEFWSLISIWGFGNTCAIIVPGEYQPYYYQLIWPSIAIIIVLGLYELSVSRKTSLILVSVLISIFFIYRIAMSIHSHYDLIRATSVFSIFNQPQSFQDPVLPYNPELIKREGLLKAADIVNILIPNKDDILYIFNFGPKGITGLTPLTYIYAKRYSPTTVDAGLLGVPTIIESKLKILKRDLIKRPPSVIIISKEIYLEPWQRKHIEPFLSWFNEFLNNHKYTIIKVFNFSHISGEKETFNVYKKLR